MVSYQHLTVSDWPFLFTDLNPIENILAILTRESLPKQQAISNCS